MALLFKEESYQIMAACFEVYNEMGYGFLEPVYQECLTCELNSKQIPNLPQRPLAIYYKDTQLSRVYEPDFLCFDRIIVELKAVSELHNRHRAQVLNYLKASRFRLGLLVNFGSHPKVQWERLVF